MGPQRIIQELFKNSTSTAFTHQIPGYHMPRPRPSMTPTLSDKHFTHHRSIGISHHAQISFVCILIILSVMGLIYLVLKRGFGISYLGMKGSDNSEPGGIRGWWKRVRLHKRRAAWMQQQHWAPETELEEYEFPSASPRQLPGNA